jgi:hypothetical protein
MQMQTLNVSHLQVQLIHHLVCSVPVTERQIAPPSSAARLNPIAVSLVTGDGDVPFSYLHHPG